jgi:hypothetical protein
MRRYPAFLLVLSLIATFIGIAIDAPPAAAGTGDDSGTAVYASPAQIRYGQNLDVRASVADIDAFTGDCSLGSCLPFPSGRVDFYPIQNGVQGAMLTSGLLQDDKGELLQSSGTGPIPYCCLKPGTYTIRGYYVPADPNPYKPSSDDTDTPITVLPGNTSTLLSQNSQTTTLGQEVTFHVQVSPENLATDAVKGFVDLREVVNGQTTIYNTSPLGANGQVDIKLSNLSGGSHSLFAVYTGGDSNYNQSTSEAITHTVSKGTATPAIVASPTSVVFGQTVTFTTTVTPVAPATVTPTGLVDLYDTNTGAFVEVTLSNGSATYTTTLPVGPHSVYAAYRGDVNYGFYPSYTPANVTVAKANTTTKVITSQPSTTLGQPVTLTASVAPVAPGAGTPTGTVQFLDGGNALGAPVSLTNGSAALTTSNIGGGTHSITAVYSGDNNFNTSTSPAVTQTVVCDRTYTGSVSSPTVGQGTTCISNATVSGSLTIPAGARVSLFNSTIGGPLTTQGAPALIIMCGTTVTGGASISNVAGKLLLGDPANGCAANSFSSLTVTSNHGGLTMVGNKVGGSLAVNYNDGGPIVVGGNTISGNLSCTGNNPQPINGGRANSVAGSRAGQCASPSF